MDWSAIQENCIMHRRRYRVGAKVTMDGCTGLGGRKGEFDDEREVLWSESWTAAAALSSGCKPADEGGESGEVPGPGAATTDRTGSFGQGES